MFVCILESRLCHLLRVESQVTTTATRDPPQICISNFSQKICIFFVSFESDGRFLCGSRGSRVALQSVDVESESREASYRDIPSIRYTRDNRPVASGEGTCENGDDEEKKKRTNRVDVVRHDTVDSARLVLSLGSTLVSRLC